MLKEVRASLYNKNGKTKLNILLNVVIAIVALVLAVEICFAINYSGVYVVDCSMNPTLLGAASENVIGGDYIYVNKHVKPDYGDIVVVYVGKNTKGEDEYFIKRAIAFGGDRVKLIEGKLYIKHKGESEFKSIDEPYIICNDTTLRKNNFHSKDDGYLVPEGHFFLMGDNRDYSVDSREPGYGSFPISSLDGVVTKWSLNHKSFCTAIYNYFRFQLPSYFGIKTQKDNL